jgi:hypothetical protein
MTTEEYEKIRDDFYACPDDPENCDRYLRAFLDWAGTVLDRLGVKYDTGREET